MSRHLVLIGFMGAGKSSVGRVVAERLNRPFVDLDEEIELQAGRPIRAIFDEDGEPAFREMEEQALVRALGAPEPSVIACGGGVVTSAANRALLAEQDHVIHLKVSAASALGRIGDVASRPMLSDAHAMSAAERLSSAREASYASVADVTIDTEGRSVDQVAGEVIAAIYEG